MHDFVNHVVHVHDDTATWGHFFANLGYALGNDVLVTGNGAFMSDDEKSLRFILNGEQTRAIANLVIGNEDVLLIDYSSDNDELLQQRYETIPNDADHYNEQDDPSTCTGEHQLTIADRILQGLSIE